MTEETTAQIIIEGWSSYCSHCGGNASPRERHHVHGGPKSMWDKDSSLSNQNGCGARFTNTDDLFDEEDT